MTPDLLPASASPHAIAASANRVAHPGAARTSGTAQDHYRRVWLRFGGRNGFFGAVDFWLYKSHDGVWRAYTFAEDYDAAVEPALAEKALADRPPSDADALTDVRGMLTTNDTGDMQMTQLTNIQIVIAIARQVQHLLADARLIAALTVAEHHENGAATDEELIAAWTLPLESARDLARAAAEAARDDARAVAWDGAWDSARDAIERRRT